MKTFRTMTRMERATHPPRARKTEEMQMPVTAVLKALETSKVMRMLRQVMVGVTMMIAAV